MNQVSNSPKYDLEERTLEFSKRISTLCRNLPYNEVNNCFIKQVIRSGTSIGANYREANETETKKDFLFRMRISRKEAKETVYWLELIIYSNPGLEKRMANILEESRALVKIISSIVGKCKNKED